MSGIGRLTAKTILSPRTESDRSHPLLLSGAHSSWITTAGGDTPWAFLATASSCSLFTITGARRSQSRTGLFTGQCLGLPLRLSDVHRYRQESWPGRLHGSFSASFPCGDVYKRSRRIFRHPILATPSFPSPVLSSVSPGCVERFPLF